MSVLLAFGSTFCAVFTLGLQSRLVNTENYAGAAVNSVLISLSHIALYKVMPDSGQAEIVAYLVGGVLGITASIWFHQRATAWWKARRVSVSRWPHVGPARHGLPRNPSYPPARRCGRCQDELPFACHRLDCPRLEITDTGS